jgi:hypothetical protein
MNCLIKGEWWNGNLFRVVIVPFRSHDLVQMKYQNANKATGAFFHAPKSFCQESLRNL